MSKLFEIKIDTITRSSNYISSNLYFFWGNAEHYIQHTPMMYTSLSPTEQVRADKFIYSNDRDYYIISHFLLNKQLSSVLELPSKSLNIYFENLRKPFITSADLDFNLSHSNNYFCFGIAKKGKVGIDIEKIKELDSLDSIINNYMHNDEKVFIYNNSNSKSEQLIKFYTIWTRKEAFLKLIGIGITTELSLINMSPNNKTISIDNLQGIDISYRKVNIYTWTNNDFVLSVCSNLTDFPQWDEINTL